MSEWSRRLASGASGPIDLETEVLELRARPSRGESSPMPTLAVGLEDRLEEAWP